MTGTEARYCDWIAVDWGTTHLRAWAMQGDAPRAEAVSERGMNTLERDAYEGALLELVGPWLGAGATPVVACGMVGARQGWVEAPYRAVPCRPVTGETTPVAVRDPRLAVRLVPGLRQAEPADVMRGEETQIAGWLAATPGFDGVVCLPGTHTKWVQVSAGEVVSFRTFMTGELFALLSSASVLRHTVAADGWDEAAFAAAVSDALSRPELFAARLFSLRAEALLAGLDGTVARARLSGTLIGAELAGARPYWLGQRVAVIGATGLAGAYRAALAQQGLEAETMDAGEATRRGLAAARAIAERTAA